MISPRLLARILAWAVAPFPVAFLLMAVHGSLPIPAFAVVLLGSWLGATYSAATFWRTGRWFLRAVLHAWLGVYGGMLLVMLPLVVHAWLTARPAPYAPVTLFVALPIATGMIMTLFMGGIGTVLHTVRGRITPADAEPPAA